jgi:hypothetical protein
MVKKIIKIIGGFVLLIIALLMWYDQSRTFYCLSDDKCITVWKRLGGKCYIVPSKHYGIFKPSNSYLQTSNTQYLTLYFTNKLPHKIIVRNQGNANEQAEYGILNKSIGNWEIIEYSEDFKSILYKTNAKKFNEVDSNTNYIDLNVKESYAIDKSGKKLR